MRPIGTATEVSMRGPLRNGTLVPKQVHHDWERGRFSAVRVDVAVSAVREVSPTATARTSTAAGRNDGRIDG